MRSCLAVCLQDPWARPCLFWWAPPCNTLIPTRSPLPVWRQKCRIPLPTTPCPHHPGSTTPVGRQRVWFRGRSGQPLAHRHGRGAAPGGHVPAADGGRGTCSGGGPGMCPPFHCQQPMASGRLKLLAVMLGPACLPLAPPSRSTMCGWGSAGGSWRGATLASGRATCAAARASRVSAAAPAKGALHPGPPLPAHHLS